MSNLVSQSTGVNSQKTGAASASIPVTHDEQLLIDSVLSETPIKNGSKEVEALQRLIQQYLPEIEETDGVIGTETQSAIKKIQRQIESPVTGNPDVRFVKDFLISHFDLKGRELPSQSENSSSAANNSTQNSSQETSPDFKNINLEGSITTREKVEFSILSEYLNSEKQLSIGISGVNQYNLLLQKTINKLYGQKVIAEDGIFGQDTEIAIRHTEEHYGLSSDGIVDSEFLLIFNAYIEGFKNSNSSNPQVLAAKSGIGQEGSHQRNNNVSSHRSAGRDLAFDNRRLNSEFSGFMLMGLSRDESIKLDSMGGGKGTPVWALNKALKEIGSNLEIFASRKRIKDVAGHTSFIGAKPSTVLAFVELGTRPELVSSTITGNGFAEPGHFTEMHENGNAFDVHASNRLSRYIVESGDFERVPELDRRGKRHKCYRDKQTGNLYYHEPSRRNRNSPGHWHVSVKNHSPDFYIKKIEQTRNLPYALNLSGIKKNS